MIIRRINRQGEAPPKQTRLRSFVTEKVRCKGCAVVRRMVGKLTGIKPPR